MKLRSTRSLELTLLLMTLMLLVGACDQQSDTEDEHGHDADAHAADQPAARGPHRGKLLEQAGFAVELGIAESGRPPAYQAWLYRDGESLPPDRGEVTVNVVRLGNVKEQHVLEPQGDGSLLASSIVGEPHSFDVEVVARIEGTTLRWTYESYEGRTRIDPAIAIEAGIEVRTAEPGIIADQHEVQGLLTLAEDKTTRLAARYAGQVKRVNAQVGDRVATGTVLAQIDSNTSLKTYPVITSMGGVVMARHTTTGDFAAEGDVLFEIADLQTLWVDLHLFGADSEHIGAGAAVVVTRLADGVTSETTVERILPGMATASQSTVARAILNNADGGWRPGAAVKARITVSQKNVAMMVPLAALQTFRDWTVVFIRIGDTYEVRPVELGERDATHVEVLSGLTAADAVVVAQSYLIKADIEKSGASHDH